jgi:hypothetical protein
LCFYFSNQAQCLPYPSIDWILSQNHGYPNWLSQYATHIYLQSFPFKESCFNWVCEVSKQLELGNLLVNIWRQSTCPSCWFIDTLIIKCIANWYSYPTEFWWYFLQANSSLIKLKCSEACAHIHYNLALKLIHCSYALKWVGHIHCPDMHKLQRQLLIMETALIFFFLASIIIQYYQLSITCNESMVLSREVTRCLYNNLKCWSGGALIIMKSYFLNLLLFIFLFFLFFIFCWNGNNVVKTEKV